MKNYHDITHDIAMLSSIIVTVETCIEGMVSPYRREILVRQLRWLQNARKEAVEARDAAIDILPLSTHIGDQK